MGLRLRLDQLFYKHLTPTGFVAFRQQSFAFID